MLKRIFRALRMELREHNSSYMVYLLFRILVICVAVFQFINRNYESFFLCILTLIMLIIPSLLQVTLRMEFPTILEITILCSIFAAEILGEIFEFSMDQMFLLDMQKDTVIHQISSVTLDPAGGNKPFII